MVRHPQRVFLTNHLASTDILAKTPKDETYCNEDLTIHKKGP